MTALTKLQARLNDSSNPRIVTLPKLFKIDLNKIKDTDNINLENHSFQICTICKDTFATRESSQSLCPICRTNHIKDRMKRNERANYNQTVFSDLYLSSSINSRRYYGIELETQCEDVEARYNLLSELSDRSAIYIIKADSSVNRTSYAFEAVTLPCDLEIAKQNISEYYNTIEKHGMQDSIYADDAQCGVHIHVNKQSFLCSIERAIYSLYRIAAKQLDFFKQLASYDNQSFSNNQYARLVNSEGKLKFAPRFRDTEAQFREFYNLVNDDRYIWLNTRSAKTIEFRLFRGTDNKNVFLGYLAAVTVLCEWVESNGEYNPSRHKIFKKSELRRFPELKDLFEAKNISDSEII